MSQRRASQPQNGTLPPETPHRHVLLECDQLESQHKQELLAFQSDFQRRTCREWDALREKHLQERELWATGAPPSGSLPQGALAGYKLLKLRQEEETCKFQAEVMKKKETAEAILEAKHAHEVRNLFATRAQGTQGNSSPTLGPQRQSPTSGRTHPQLGSKRADAKNPIQADFKALPAAKEPKSGVIQDIITTILRPAQGQIVRRATNGPSSRTFKETESVSVSRARARSQGVEKLRPQVETINLCSDDEDWAPFSKLFSSTPTISLTSIAAYGHEADPKIKQERHGSDGTAISSAAEKSLPVLHRQSPIAPRDPQETCKGVSPGEQTGDTTPSKAKKHGSPNRRKKPIPFDPRPELSLGALKQQREDRSKILRDPTSLALPRNSALHSLQQYKKDGSFVKSILQNERSQTWSAGLGAIFEQSGRNIAIYTTPSKEATPLSRKGNIVGSRKKDTVDLQAPLPGSSPNVSLPSPSTPKAALRSVSPGGSKSTETPISTPAGVEASPLSRTSRTVTHETTAFTRGSTRAPASPITPTSLHSSGTRKRKEVSVSDDDSDFDSESMPSPKTPKKSQAKNIHSEKRLRGADGSAQAKSVARSMASSIFSPRTRTPPSSVVDSGALPPTPKAPKAKKFLPIPTAALRSPSFFPARRGERKAKLAARSKIEEYTYNSMEFSSDEEIRKASEKEERIKSRGMVNAEPALLRKRLRRLSLTPSVASQGNRSDREEIEPRGGGSIYSNARWTQDRFAGDRFLARSHAREVDEEEDFEGIVLSKWQR